MNNPRLNHEKLKSSYAEILSQIAGYDGEIGALNAEILAVEFVNECLENAADAAYTGEKKRKNPESFEFDPASLEKYPFLAGISSYVKCGTIQLETLLSSRAFASFESHLVKRMDAEYAKKPVPETPGTANVSNISVRELESYFQTAVRIRNERESYVSATKNKLEMARQRNKSICCVMPETKEPGSRIQNRPKSGSKSNLKLGPIEIAKYPFLADAGPYVRSLGIRIEDLGTNPSYKTHIELAMERIGAACDGAIFRTLKNNLDSLDQERETVSFLLAVILLKLSGMQTLVRRFALAEARRAEKYLETDLRINPAEKFQLTKKLIGDLFSVNIDHSNDDLIVPASDYLVRAANFHEREWNLVNRRVSKGWVYLTRREAVRLLRTEIGSYIQEKIRSARMPTMQPGFEAPVSRLTEIAKRFASETVVVSGERPPCIKHAIEILEKGENLSHSGRFMLATFLLNRGQSVGEIAPLFKNAPDYNERTTSYQLRNLSGESGGGTKYTCPSCEKIKSRDMCFADEKCNDIFTPLHYGRKKVA